MKKNKLQLFNYGLKACILLVLLFTSAYYQILQAQGQEPATTKKTNSVNVEVGPVHPWRPPFHLDRVGHSSEAIITIDWPELPEGTFKMITYLRGKEISRQPVQFSGAAPFKARKPLPENTDQVALFFTGTHSKIEEIARRKISLSSLEFEAVAQPAKVINPIDLGAILVPADWLLLQHGQKANLSLAVISRTKEVSSVRATAWYGSAPAGKVNSNIVLNQGKKMVSTLALPENIALSDHDTLNIVITNTTGKELWKKQISVMIVPEQQAWPSFGAVKTKLRYDPPVTNIINGKNIPFSYTKAWTTEKEDYVVFLPNGSRWVFWRGSSYIPFWASRYNTGLSYEWAERISPNTGFTDCPEPLMDKELRYGKVEIIESTSSRVHVRWNYQSCDFNYKVNGDFSQEDYYFYPDGMGTRVLTLTCIPEAEYEVAEFILLASQAALPFDIMPEKPMDIISLNSGRKVEISLPEKDTSWKKIEDPGIYRMRLHKKEPMAAFSFNPLLLKKPFAFGPFYDKGQVVTPAYWGGHWPLSQGFNTGRAINESIWSGPSHNSLLTWAAKRPQPLHSETLMTKDALGVLKTMRKETYAWLIGMTDASDKTLLNTARSFARPAKLELKGAVAGTEIYSQERRAFCLEATDKKITITIKPVEWCVNPVFELKGVNAGLINAKLGNKILNHSQYAWDGKTLWIKAAINQPATIELTFSK
jgi:hypothetical protein